MSKYIKDSRTSTEIIKEMKSCTRSLNRQLLQQLESNNILSTIMNDYEQKAQNHDLYNLSRNTNAISKTDADRLINLYTNHSSKLTEMILNHQKNNSAKQLCWQCRLRNIAEYVTLDHFLPKNFTDGYPELSFYPNNLVPSCSSCNSGHKGSDYKDDKLKIVKSYNPYYYDIDTTEILYFNFCLKNGIPDFNFYLDLSSITNIKLKMSIEKEHSSDGLNLLDRYKEQVSNDLDNFVMSFESSANNPEKRFNDWLSDQILHMKNTIGINYWKCAFYKGLLNNHDAFVFFQTRKNQLKQKYSTTTVFGMTPNP